jgi:ABC-type branched-subunit amino acid transport system substrate-binding protein
VKRTALLLALLLTAACGSTVQQTGGTAAGVEAGDDVSSGDELSAASGTSDSATDGTAAPGAAPNGNARTRVTASQRAQAAANQAAGSRGGAVKVGIRYPSNSSGLIGTLGFADIDPGDSKAMAQTVVEDINTRGGIAGRKIEPVYFPFDVTASTAPGGGDAENQKACSAFTEDTKVFAVVSPIVSGEVLQNCLAQRGVAFVDENWNYIDAYSAGYWTPAYPDTVRSFPALVDRLVATGFITRTAKIGAVYQDLKNRKKVVDQALRPALARHGLKLDATVAWTPQGADAFASGVLRFQAAQITHVFVLDPGGLETFGWMAEAESQGFRPKYALDTRNYPFLQQGQSPPAQLANARGIGWVPAADVGVQPDAELTPAERRCLGVVAKAGQDMQDATNVRVAFAYCNTLEFLKAAAGDASTDLSFASVQRGGEGLGDRFTPVGTFAVRFGPGRHDGAIAARDFAYDTGCSCFRYTGPVFSFG